MMNPNVLYLVQNVDLVSLFTIAMTGVLLTLYCALIVRRDVFATHAKVNSYLSEFNPLLAIRMPSLANPLNQRVLFIGDDILFYTLTYTPSASVYSSFYMWNHHANVSQQLTDNFRADQSELEQV